MATEKQHEANRKNSLASTGPKTAEGKNVVRSNAIKHGLRADTFELIDGEDPAEFDARLAGWNRVYVPTNEVETELVRQAVVLSWKLDRALRFENAALADRVHAAVLACDCDDNDTKSLIQAASLAFFDPSPEGEKLRRYQSTIRRDLLRTLAELAKLRGRTVTPMPDGVIGANKAISDACRTALDLAETADRRSPHTEAGGGSVAPNKINSAAPNEANPVAPNKANSPVPKKPLSARGARELARFVSGAFRDNARNSTWVDVSIEKR